MTGGGLLDRGQKAHGRISQAAGILASPSLLLIRLYWGWTWRTMKIDESGSRYLGSSAFVFALLQSLCPAVIGLSAVRVAIGAGALVFAAGTAAAIGTFHQALVRIPMMLFALVGATVNLFVIWHLRRLRKRPAAQWRVTPVTVKKLRSERLQIGLALLTYLCLITEWVTHIKLHHHY
jgi:hypothetical protein